VNFPILLPLLTKFGVYRKIFVKDSNFTQISPVGVRRSDDSKEEMSLYIQTRVRRQFLVTNPESVYCTALFGCCQDCLSYYFRVLARF